ncbi:MAG: sigma-54 dependent transcriptional regulator [Spirochaetia bacterium]
MTRVLLIDPDRRSFRTLGALLPENFLVVHHPEPALSADRVRSERPDIVLLEVDLGELDGIAVLKTLVDLPQAPPILILTALRHTRLVVEAMRSGAADYLTKPFALRELVTAMMAALERRGGSDGGPAGVASQSPLLSLIVGESAPAREQRRHAQLYAAASAPVIVLGESGTGKDLFARVTHGISSRHNGPYVAVNCGAIPESLFESEMFGVTRGAYTDAVERPGPFEQADTGTLFLDEVGELSPRAQVKLLRALEERRVRRVGSSVERPVDVRVIAASNRPLYSEVKHGRFRSDLFYRLNILALELSPLRERREDVPILASHFLNEQVPNGTRFTDAALEKLMGHDWPGNVRELRNLVERAGLLARDRVVLPSDVTFV